MLIKNIDDLNIISVIKLLSNSLLFGVANLASYLVNLLLN
jgi:hypothetical protein